MEGPGASPHTQCQKTAAQQKGLRLYTLIEANKTEDIDEVTLEATGKWKNE